MAKTEKEIEALAMDPNDKDAKFILGILAHEGSHPDIVAKNEKKGLNWLKEAAEKGQLDAQEFMAFYDIKHTSNPNLKKIMKNLENACAGNASAKAFSTLAELYLNSQKSDSNVQKAFELYKKAADIGDLIAKYWVGVLYHRGSGVEKDLDKAIVYLTAASELGNSQADHELFDIYCREPEKKDMEKGYNYLLDAMENGITAFADATNIFKENLKELK